MEKYLRDFIKKNNLNLYNQKIALAVSTGIDSMAMLHSFLSIKDEFNLQIIVCHVNHHRREQADVEEEYIKEFCEKNNLKCYVKDLYFVDNSNFQAQARSKRYQFFYETMEKENCYYLALAHHFDDLMETILMRIFRGSSLSGYKGISEVTSYGNKIIIHPFLNILKDDIIKYQKEKGFVYFFDESNDHLDYTRNKIRHLIIPNIRNNFPNANNGFKEFSSVINEASNHIMQEVKVYIDRYVNFTSQGFTLLTSDFLNLDSFLQKEVLFELLKKYQLSKKNIEEIIKWINSDKKNIMNNYKGLVFLKEYDKISFLNEEVLPMDVKIEINDLGKYRVNDSILINVTEKKDNNITNLYELCYNIQKLPIYIRSRQDGDKILLSSGYKKVKDVLIDEKIGVSRRNNILLAVDSNDNVLIIFGVKKSRILDSKNDNNIIIRVEENYE